MSPSDLDLSMHPDADQIRRREFVSVRRGYDPDQVREYLAAVAAQVERLEARLRDERRRTEQAMRSAAAAPAQAPEAVAAPPVQEGPDPYERLAQRLAGLIGTADREAARIVDEARAEAEAMNEDARIQADRMRLDGQSQAEEVRAEADRVLADARDESDRVLGGLEAERVRLSNEIQEMRDHMLSVAKGFEGMAETEHEGPAQARVAAPVTRMDDAEPDTEGSSDDDDIWADDDALAATLLDESGGPANPPGEAPDLDLPTLSAIDLDLDPESGD